VKRNDFSAEFKSPGSWYRGQPFWAWNGALDPEELRRQIRLMKRMGMGGFFMHSRVGLATPYLKDEWFQCIEACIDEARAQGFGLVLRSSEAENPALPKPADDATDDAGGLVPQEGLRAARGTARRPMVARVYGGTRAGYVPWHTSHHHTLRHDCLISSLSVSSSVLDSWTIQPLLTMET
jgi:hypothetical protein